MKYQRAPEFIADYGRLDPRERELFKDAVRRLNDSFDARGDQPLPAWPKGLRVKSVRGARGVWELTWSFSGPDGRATFEIVDLNGEPAIRWRRVGGHEIFSAP